MAWVGFFLFNFFFLFLCNLSVKGHYPSPFRLLCIWHIRENTSDAPRCQIFPGWLSAAGTSGSRPASSPCQPGDDAQPAPSGSLFLSHPQNPSGSQFTIFNQWQTLSIFPPLDRVRFPLRWKYLAYFEQRALPLPSPSHTPGLRRVSSPISVTHPHTQHFPTPLILSYFCCSGPSRAGFQPSFVPMTCPRPVPLPHFHGSLPLFPALKPLFPSFFFSFSPNTFWFHQTVHHGYSSAPSLSAVHAGGLSGRLCAPWLDRFQAFQGVFKMFTSPELGDIKSHFSCKYI